EDARRRDRAGAEHDLLRVHEFDATVALDVETGDAAGFEAYAMHDRARANAQVPALAHLRSKVAACGAHPHACDLVHRVRTVAGLVRLVAVGTGGESELGARFEESSLPRRELVLRMSAQRDRAVFAVPLVLEIEIGLETLERRQALLERPIGESA